jgi:hypothetical protein
MVFMIVDKKDAKVFAFNADGQLRGAARPVGLARGDDLYPVSVTGVVGHLPEERTIGGPPWPRWATISTERYPLRTTTVPFPASVG